MAFGDYYNPTNKIVNSGDIVYADDINSINAAVDAGFAQVAADFDAVTAGQVAVSQAWATADRGVRPDLAQDKYSSKANALEAQDWATAPGLITEAKTNLPLAGSKSAKTYAAEAASSASSASGFATTATTQAGIATTQAGLATGAKDTAVTNAGTATTQAGIATTKATEAQDWASKAVNVVVSAGKYSALHYATKAAESVAGLSASVVAIGALTPAADKIPYYTGATTAALATFTAAGRALMDDIDAAAQRTTLGLGNVPNLDCTNATNITSGTLADARIASTITRDDEVNTATTTALALKAPLSSPVFTGTPALTNTPLVNDNSTKLASTAFVVGQAGTATPLMNGTAAVGTSLLYSREDHRHGSDTAKASLASPAFTGTPTAPTAAGGTNTAQVATTAFVATAVAAKAPVASPSFTGDANFAGSANLSGGVYTSGTIQANNNALRANGWGGNTGNGVVFFGNGNSHIYKLGNIFQFNLEGIGTATINKGGTVAMTTDIPAAGMSKDATSYEIGSIIMGVQADAVEVLADGTASKIMPCNAAGATGTNPATTGTWRCLGYSNSANKVTCWQRIL